MDADESLIATSTYDDADRHAGEGRSGAESAAGALRLGPHHFAHLRSIAQGIGLVDSAKRYLNVDHAASAITAHRLVLERLRALVRRRGDRRWRLIGVVIPAARDAGGGAGPSPASRSTAAEPPSIDAWAEEHGLEDWSQHELQAMYLAAFPSDRKSDRNRRLLERQLALLFELERSAAETPRPSDAVAGWFDEATAQRFMTAGWATLDDVRRAIARGGRWWRSMPGVGQVKAGRLASYLAALLPQAPQRPRLADGYVQHVTGALARPSAEITPAATIDVRADSNRAIATPAGTAASTDREAIDAWIAAKAGSPATARAYRKEAERLMVWSMLERSKPLSSMNLDDCLAYLTFLEHLPEDWVSLRHAKRHEAGWTPFKGALSASSRRYALGVLSALFDWLVSAGYLRGNPWRLVNRKISDDRFVELDSRAFTPEAWEAIAKFLEAHASAGGADPARERIEFLLAFLEATGLRASELVQARLGDLRRVNRAWVLQVVGKGGKARLVVVPTQAAQALDRYLQRRGIGRLVDVDLLDDELASLPLVVSTLDPREAVSYSALYRSTKTWFGKAIWASDLEIREKLDASKASLHWLRHTCGTRALDRGVSIETVQRQLGHADLRTTMRYAKPQLDRVQAEMEKGFG